MREEKMMILSMLEEGKITPEEAVKLMEALEDVESPKENTEQNQSEDVKEEKTSRFQFNTLEDIGSDISNALSNMFSGLKDIGSSIGLKGNYETITADLNMNISHIENPSLDLKAINGAIKLRPWADDNILIKVTCQHKHGLFNKDDKFYNFQVEGSKLVFTPTYNSGISIRLDVSLPEKNYDEIILNSTNGKIDIDDLNLNILKCITTNASVDILDINAKDITLSTKNGKIECKDINSNKIDAITSNASISIIDMNSAYIDLSTANGKVVVKDVDATIINGRTSNGSIEVRDVKSETIHLATSNGKITCDDFDLEKIKDVELITSNSSINSDIHRIKKEVHFDLETSMGNVTLELPNLVYKTNKQVNLGLKKIVAHTIDFNENNDNLKFVASTSNGSIKIS